MGALLSRFRKEATTEQKLEQLQEKIKNIEEYGVNTQERKKRFVGTFLAVAVGIYVIAAFSMVYFVYFPVTWKEGLLYVVPLLIFPYIILLLRRLFTWHFERKLSKNSAMLTKLRAEKKDILEQVMDKETYKVAVNLLQRFGDRSINQRHSLGVNQRPSGTSPQVNNLSSLRELSRPTTTTTTISSNLANPSKSVTPAHKQSSPLVVASQTMTPHMRGVQQLRRRTPFPIINPAEKGIFERCLDFLIGDGPQDRFAIICKECHSHNGMALKEEFDYITYRCAFCNAMNPARKTRPVAPRLILQNADAGTSRAILHSRSDDSSNSTVTPDASDDDDNDDALERTRRRVPVRLTESTVNHSESPEVASQQDIIPTDSSAPTPIHVNEPNRGLNSTNPFENNSDTEPMDGVEESIADIGDIKTVYHQQHAIVSDAEKKAN